MTDRSDRLRQARITAGFRSASAAAKSHGWTPSTYIAHENGQNDYEAAQAEAYAKAFGVDPGWLLLGTARGAPPSGQHIDPVLGALWQRMTPSQRRKLLQIAVIMAEE